jgi:mercuric ion transport protein
MEKQTLVSVGAVTAAVIASLCCIGPVLVVFLGVGSIAAFSAFEIYRPYLIGLTVALIGLAFFLTYRKREVRCEDGSCKMESASKWAKKGVWTVTIVAGLAIAFPYLNFAPQTSVNKAVDSTAVVTLNLSGMDCNACAKGLEATLSRAAGVKKAAVEFENSRAVVEYDSTKTTVERLIAVVDETGFKVKRSKTPDHSREARP